MTVGNTRRQRRFSRRYPILPYSNSSSATCARCLPCLLTFCSAPSAHLLQCAIRNRAFISTSKSNSYSNDIMQNLNVRASSSFGKPAQATVLWQSGRNTAYKYILIQFNDDLMFTPWGHRVQLGLYRVKFRPLGIIRWPCWTHFVLCACAHTHPQSSPLQPH